MGKLIFGDWNFNFEGWNSISSLASSSNVISTVTGGGLDQQLAVSGSPGWINGILGNLQSGGQNTQTATASQGNYYNLMWNQLSSQQINFNQLISSIGAFDESPEEQAARKKREAERHAKRKMAEIRAENLLFTILTPDQVRSYNDERFFEQEVNGRLYRIRDRISGNVELIEKGKAVAKYCAHPTDAREVPVPDVMLSQLLALRANEAEFLRVANRTVLQ